MNSLETYFDQFLKYLKVQRQCSPLTLEGYRSDFKILQRFLHQKRVPRTLGSITPEVIQDYFYFLDSEGYKVSSIRRRLYSLSSFFDWCVNWDYLTKHPMRRLSIPKRPVSIPKAIPLVDLGKLLKAPLEGRYAPFHPEVRFRDRVLLELLVKTGLRKSEATALSWQDVNLVDRTILVRKGKGGKTRIVPIVDDLYPLLKQFRRGKGTGLEDPVFLSLARKRMAPRTVNKVLERALRFAGLLNRGYTVHSLRHTFATMLRAKRADIADIRDLLGHEDISTTMIYAQADMSRLRSVVGLLTDRRKRK